MSARTVPRRPLPRRGHMLGAVAVAAALLLVGVLGLTLRTSGGPATGPPELLRVTSGNEIATGFSVGGDRILTVAHVLDAAPAGNGPRGPVAVDGRRARVLLVDHRTDLALLSVRGLHGRSVQTAEAAGGADVRVLRLRNGRSSSLSGHVRRAIVAHVRAAGAARAVTRPALELAARVSPGDSGAPVLSRSDTVVGVVFAGSRSRDGTAYAVDASAVARLLARRPSG